MLVGIKIAWKRENGKPMEKEEEIPENTFQISLLIRGRCISPFMVVHWQ